MEAIRRSRNTVLGLSLLLPAGMALAASPAVLAQDAPAAAPATSCSNVPHSDHPHAVISNGQVQALVFLPDAANGYYRAARFDWSGVIGCAVYSGHSFWGEWFSQYDPLVNDSITGPVEEFRSDEGALGYNAAGQGGSFVKIGVGVLKRDTAEPYKFGHAYPILDGGKWTTHVHKNSVEFEQKLKSPTGVVYEYSKEVSLSKEGSTLTLSHKLKNLGKAPIVTAVYDHDFFMLDNQPTGPGMQVSFPFVPVPEDSLVPRAEVFGKKLIYRQALEPHQQVATYITGYSNSPSDYKIRVEDTVHKFGIEQTADATIAKLYLWSIPTTISPEAYINLNIAPGQTASWKIHYRMFTAASEAADKARALATGKVPLPQ